MIKEKSFQGDMTRDWTFTDDGVIEVKTTQDVEPYLKRNSDIRNENRKAGDFHYYASVPMVVVEELYKKGINIFDQNDTKKVIEVIERDYPYLKTTNLREC